MEDAADADSTQLRIISPFIKLGTVEKLIRHRPPSIQVMTRFNLNDFAVGVSDISALARLLKAGAKVRGLRNLHSKVYMFGSRRAIVTSANLTDAALNRNHEFGLVSEEPAIVSACAAYFDDLWHRGGSDLTREKLDEWAARLDAYHLQGGATASIPKLPDFGADGGIPPESAPTAEFAEARQAFVKFAGSGTNRQSLSFGTIDDALSGGRNWAATYPRGKRPRAVRDGALIYIARFTKDPNDLRIYGRAIGMRHVEGRDDATTEEIELRPWKKDWPHYVRVHDAEFIAGTLANGVSLNELMATLAENSFAATQRNAAAGQGNRNPRKAYLRQPAVELAPEGVAWLNEQFEAALCHHGRASEQDLARLDWPHAFASPT